MVRTRTSNLRRRIEGNSWSVLQTQTLVEIVHTWAQESSLAVTTNRDEVLAKCTGDWSDQLFERLWVRKTSEQIGGKLIRLRNLHGQIELMLDMAGVGYEQEKGLVHVPPTWNVRNEPAAHVYLRTVGLADADKLGYIFNAKQLALFSFENNAWNPIILN